MVGGLASTFLVVHPPPSPPVSQVYNATVPRMDPASPLTDVTAAVHINITSLHAAFYALLPGWRAGGRGTLLLTGGGLAGNGAWSVGMGMQFGAPVKAYVWEVSLVLRVCLCGVPLCAALRLCRCRRKNPSPVCWGRATGVCGCACLSVRDGDCSVLGANLRDLPSATPPPFRCEPRLAGGAGTSRTLRRRTTPRTRPRGSTCVA